MAALVGDARLQCGDGAVQRTITPERTCGDERAIGRYATPHRSVSSSRYSGLLSCRSSARDEQHARDEWLRKQRVVRCIAEERERAERARLLREEHDVWVELRACERAARLHFMTEHEIAALLRREAAEALQEKALAEMAAQYAAEEALRRRRSLAALRRVHGGDEAAEAAAAATTTASAQQRNNGKSNEGDVTTAAAQRNASVALAEARKALLQLRDEAATRSSTEDSNKDTGESTVVTPPTTMYMRRGGGADAGDAAVYARVRDAAVQHIRDATTSPRATTTSTSTTPTAAAVVADATVQTDVMTAAVVTTKSERDMSVRQQLQWHSERDDKEDDRHAEADASRWRVRALDAEAAAQALRADLWQLQLQLQRNARAAEQAAAASCTVAETTTRSTQTPRHTPPTTVATTAPTTTPHEYTMWRTEVQRERARRAHVERELAELRTRYDDAVAAVAALRQQLREARVQQTAPSRTRDAHAQALQRARAELATLRGALADEAAARAHFEELAAQAVTRNTTTSTTATTVAATAVHETTSAAAASDLVPLQTLQRVQAALQESEQRLSAVTREAAATRARLVAELCEARELHTPTRPRAPHAAADDEEAMLVRVDDGASEAMAATATAVVAPPTTTTTTLSATDVAGATTSWQSAPSVEHTRRLQDEMRLLRAQLQRSRAQEQKARGEAAQLRNLLAQREQLVQHPQPRRVGATPRRSTTTPVVSSLPPSPPTATAVAAVTATEATATAHSMDTATTHATNAATTTASQPPPPPCEASPHNTPASAHAEVPTSMQRTHAASVVRDAVQPPTHDAAVAQLSHNTADVAGAVGAVMGNDTDEDKDDAVSSSPPSSVAAAVGIAHTAADDAHAVHVDGGNDNGAAVVVQHSAQPLSSTLPATVVPASAASSTPRLAAHTATAPPRTSPRTQGKCRCC